MAIIVFRYRPQGVNEEVLNVGMTQVYRQYLKDSGVDIYLPTLHVEQLMFTKVTAENTHHKGSITVHLTSCLFSLDSATLLMLNEQLFYLFDKIQTSQTGGQP